MSIKYFVALSHGRMVAVLIWQLGTCKSTCYTWGRDSKASHTVVNGEGKSLELVVGPSIEDIDALPVSVVFYSDAVVRTNADGVMYTGRVGTGLTSCKHPHLDAHLVHRCVLVHICKLALKGRRSSVYTDKK